MDDEAISTLITRLARPHASGGRVIERAAILAAGADFPSVMAWIVGHDGQPETGVASPVRGGLHGSRVNDGGGARARQPLRFVLPADQVPERV